jgi:hypothetical protein
MQEGVELDEVSREEVDDLYQELKVSIDVLARVIERCPPTPLRTRWWRGFGKEASAQIRRTGKWVSTKITSLTANEKVAEGFGEAWKVIVPAGGQVLYISVLLPTAEGLEFRPWRTVDEEEEALVGRGTFTQVGMTSTLVFRKE